MRIDSLPQESGLLATMPAPAHLVEPQFIGNAVIHDGYNGGKAAISLYQCNSQLAHGVTRVVAVTRYGTSFVFIHRKLFELNSFMASEIMGKSSIISIVFRSEWL